MKNDTVRLSVLEFLSDTLKISKTKIHSNDNLFHDLGVDGDDAIELIQDYSKKFNVSLDDFRIDKYFGSEGSSLIHFIVELITKKSQKSMPRLTVEDLIEGVKSGRLKK